MHQAEKNVSLLSAGYIGFINEEDSLLSSQSSKGKPFKKHKLTG